MRKVAIIVPYTSDYKILLQKRNSISRYGELWSFFGGGIEKGESAKDAILRECKEELDFYPKSLFYFGKIKDKIREQHVHYNIFVTFVVEDSSRFTVKEGDGLDFFTVSEAKRLKLIPRLDEKTLKIVQEYWSRTSCCCN